MPGRVAEPASDGRTRWNTRIARARVLAAESSSAREPLTFYAGLAERQRDTLDRSGGRTASSDDRAFREALDVEPALAAIPALLSWLGDHAPAALAQAARALHRLEPGDWRDAMRVYVWDDPRPDDTEHAVEFVVSAVLQPFAEELAVARRDANHAGADAARCPLCAGPPVVGVLREEGHGGRRALVCAFCLAEHEYRRVVCPACGEQSFDALPVYTSDTFAHVRIDACDSCRTYIKTIDMTKDGLAEPIVDDVATVALDLWARDKGYQRLRQNLLRL